MNEVQLCLYHHIKRYMDANGMTTYDILKTNPFPVGKTNINEFLTKCKAREDFAMSNKLTATMFDFFDVPYYIDRFDKLHLVSKKEKPLKRVEFKLTEEEDASVEYFANKEGVTRSEFIRQAVVNEIKAKTL